MFLHGILEDRVLYDATPSYEEKKHPTFVCKLDKALYGLKQAPRAWYSHLSTRLQELGFIPSQAGKSLFIYNEKGIVTYILICVDIIVTSSSNDAVKRLLHDLSEDFAFEVWRIKFLLRN